MLPLPIEGTTDIIVTDIIVPETDGFELFETLKQDVRTSHIPIILLTAIAFNTGFSDSGYFSRLFHKGFGLSPTNDREREMPAFNDARR